MSRLRKHRDKLLPALLLVIAIALGFRFRSEIEQWFSPSTAGPDAPKGHDAHGTAQAPPKDPPAAADKGGDAEPEPLPPQHFPEPITASLRVVLDAYEEIRARLSADALDGVEPRARRIADALRSSMDGVTDASSVRETMDRGAKAAERLAQTTEVEAARAAFGDVSREIVLLVGADDRLSEGHHVFKCPMAKGYRQWIQTTDRLENPYMGQKMLTCGSETEFPSPAASAPSDHAGHEESAHGANGDVAHYTCPMHPSVKQADPGTCPICGMDLVPVTKQEVETGVIIVDAARRQLIGVKTTKIASTPVKKHIRTVGKIVYDETRLSDVSLKFKGWIERLHVSATGERVRRGQTLFAVYSPEVYGALQDLIIARGSGGSNDGTTYRGNLTSVARRRLELWDVPRSVIDKALETGKVPRTVPIVAPASGFVVEKNVVEGSTVEAGARLYRIANLEQVWIEAELYEAELPLVELDQPAKVSLPYLPDEPFEGKVSFVYPYLRGTTRTGQVRIELANPKVELKPDMYANVEIEIDRGERLVVPESAVIYAGPRRLVFLDLGEGRLRPQEVEIGIKVDDAYEVLSGLEVGDKVVTSGNFLIAAESRLKSAVQKW